MSIHPGRFDDTVQRRVVYDLILQIEDREANPIDLTGWTADAQVWDRPRTVKYADFSITYLDLPKGKIKMALTAADTTSLPSVCYYDVLLTDPSGRAEYYLDGTLYLSEGYTT